MADEKDPSWKGNYFNGRQSRDGEIQKLVEVIKMLIENNVDTSYKYLDQAREALKPYQSPVKETI